jgi:hypothetical protein
VLTSIQKKFLWGGVSHGAKMCKMAWSVVIWSKNRGGLGLGSLQGKNKALLFKWLWCLGDNHPGGWQDFISTTYCPAFENGLPLFNRPLSATWRGIYSIINSDTTISSSLKNSCSYTNW